MIIVLFSFYINSILRWTPHFVTDPLWMDSFTLAQHALWLWGELSSSYSYSIFSVDTYYICSLFNFACRLNIILCLLWIQRFRVQCWSGLLCILPDVYRITLPTLQWIYIAGAAYAIFIVVVPAINYNYQMDVHMYDFVDCRFHT